MLLDFIDLSAGDRKAAYRRLYDQIKTAAENGIIKKGERLPSIREAAAQLGISRTTVENAYVRLCIAGIAESLPQKGYYIILEKKAARAPLPEKPKTEAVLYDLTARKIDIRAADTDLWKKTVREVLRDNEQLTSYGDPQGEYELRTALSAYAYQARGVRCRAENIVVGAGVGSLLQFLCGLTGRNGTVGMENGGFLQAEQIFSDYGVEVCHLASDRSGARVEALINSGVQTLFLLPSALAKLSVTELASRRGEFVKWARQKNDRLIIEDDYNGELRYTARSMTAFQANLPEKTVYIGSFSKLLLPSVRIAYMVLPDRLAECFAARRELYNPTCGKAEQLALTRYLQTGALEKHLRRLRKRYSQKSRRFCAVLSELFPQGEQTLYESSLTVRLNIGADIASESLCAAAQEKGIKIMPAKNRGEVRLCFAGIEDADIEPALHLLKDCFEKAVQREAS